MKKYIYGYELIIDLYDCSNAVITSKRKLKSYVDTLCKLIRNNLSITCFIPDFLPSDLVVPYEKNVPENR